MGAWATAPVFIRLLRNAYDPFTQAFVRYLSGMVVLVVVSLIGYRADMVRLLRHPLPLMALAVLNVTMQSTWTIGCYLAPATVAQVITKLQVVFVIVFSFFLFREERGVIRNPLYFLGTTLSFVGVAAVLTTDPRSLRPVFDKAAVMLLTTAFLWAVYLVWAKYLVADVHPVPMFTVLSIFTTAGFGFISMAYRAAHPEVTIEAGWSITLVAVVSGLLPIAAAHPAFHYAQKYLGSAFCASVNLLNPLLTYLISLVALPAERLLLSQWIGAAILVTGTLLVTYAGHRAHFRKDELLPEMHDAP